MANRKFKLRKKRYGKTNRGATFIHNVIVEMTRNRETEKRKSEKARKNAAEKSEVAAIRKTSKKKSTSIEHQEEKHESQTSAETIAYRQAFLKAMRSERNIKSSEPIDEPSRTVRWFGFWFSMALMFLGIHFMKTSTHSWLWFVPMLLPIMGVLQIESERPQPLGTHRDPEKRTGKATAFLPTWTASIIAVIGIYLMIESSTNWYWFIPLLIPLFILLPQKMKQWEKEDEEEKIQKAERKAERKEWRASSPLWKYGKIVFWLGLIWLTWPWVGFYLYMFVLGLAR